MEGKVPRKGLSLAPQLAYTNETKIAKNLFWMKRLRSGHFWDLWRNYSL